MVPTLTAGDTFDWPTAVPAYPASDGWTLKYRLWQASGTAEILLTAIAEGDAYRVQAGPSTTATWAPGAWYWSSWVEKTGAKHTLEHQGSVTILPNPATVTAYDGRTIAEKALDDAETALASFNATGGRVKRYAIAGREMEFDAAGDILTLVSYWQTRVKREHDAKAVASGKADPRRFYVGAGRA
jgi:hypothetical protein